MTNEHTPISQLNVPADLPESIFVDIRVPNRFDKNTQQVANAHKICAPSLPTGPTEQYDVLDAIKPPPRKVFAGKMLGEMCRQNNDRIKSAMPNEVVTLPTVNPLQAPPPVEFQLIKSVQERLPARFQELRKCISRQELSVFLEAWNEWTIPYGVTPMSPADTDDIFAICLETMKRFRFELQEYRNNASMEKHIEGCERRKQVARNNLQERYDQAKDKSNRINIAMIVSGQKNGVGREDRNADLTKRHERDIEDFFNSTAQSNNDPFAIVQQNKEDKALADHNQKQQQAQQSQQA